MKLFFGMFLMGVSAVALAGSAYHVELKPGEALTSIYSAKPSLVCTIVFAESPTVEQAQAAVVSEVHKAADQNLDIDALVKIGQPNEPDTWRQMRDPNDGFIMFRYDASNRMIYRKNIPIEA